MTGKAEKKTIELASIETVVRVWPRSSHAMFYEVFFAEARDEAGFRFWIKGASSNAQTTPNLDEAVVAISGWINFDGCSENVFDLDGAARSGAHHYHGCSREDLTRLGQVFDCLFDEAAAMPGEEFLRRGGKS